MLDVGCGIGGSSRHLARKYGAATKGITLSPVQAKRGQALAAEQGLGDRCSFQVGPRTLLSSRGATARGAVAEWPACCYQCYRSGAVPLCCSTVWKEGLGQWGAGCRSCSAPARVDCCT